MTDMVENPIPVDNATAEPLADTRTRAAMGRLLSRLLRPRAGDSVTARGSNRCLRALQRGYGRNCGRPRTSSP